jgi:hypothetical protein
MRAIPCSERSIRHGCDSIKARRWLASIILIAAVALSSGRVASAAVPVWIAGDGNWSVPGNWNTAAVPTAGDAVNVFNVDGVSRTITYDYTGPAVTLASLVVNLNGGTPSDTESLSMVTNNLTAVIEYVGYSGGGGSGRGTVNQSGGVNTITGVASDSFYLGFYATDIGVYNLSGSGSLVASAPEVIGFRGSGTFNQSGGVNNTVGITVGISGVAGVGGSTGTYILSGGSLTTVGESISSSVGSAFNQTGGANTVNGSLSLGTNAGTTGTYSLGGTGVLTVSGTNELVGSSGT